MANLFEKIQNVRVELANANLKMTGKNTYAKYDYFELSDFVKTLNELMQKHKMTAIPTFTRETAVLTAINCENPDEKYSITSPFSSADLQGCQEVQIIGAVETYQRRYLYQAMFDIAENDGLNATQGRDKNNKKTDEKKETDNKFNCSLCNENVSTAEKEFSLKTYKKILCRKCQEKIKAEKVETESKDLPFPQQGINDKSLSKEELKAQRQAELMKLGAEYYKELVSTQWQTVLRQISAMEGKKFSEMTDAEYQTICEKIKRREY